MTTVPALICCLEMVTAMLRHALSPWMLRVLWWVCACESLKCEVLW